jgi:hypothetical protein
VSALTPKQAQLLENAVANGRLEGQELSEEHRALAAEYLTGEIDAATYEARVLELVTGPGTQEAQSA